MPKSIHKKRKSYRAVSENKSKIYRLTLAEKSEKIQTNASGGDQKSQNFQNKCPKAIRKSVNFASNI